MLKSELIARLEIACREFEHDTDDGAQRRAAGAAVAAVLEYVETSLKSHRPDAGELMRPAAHLLSRLGDLEKGKSDPIFKTPKKAGAPPLSAETEISRQIAAAAVEIRMTVESESVAVRAVRNKLTLLGWQDGDNDVMNWRKVIRQQPPKEVELYWQLTSGWREHGDSATAVADAILKSADKPPVRKLRTRNR